MRKVILIVFLTVALLETGVGIYFLWGYLTAWNSSVTNLGPAWSKLTTYWLASALRSLSFGFITAFTTYLLLRRKKASVWLAILSVVLLFIFLLSIKPLILV